MYTDGAPTLYTFPSLDWGNNVSERFGIMGPKGKRGTLIDYGVQGVTETFTGSITIAVGTAADPDAYGEEWDLSAATAATDLGGKTVRGVGGTIAAIDLIIVQPNLPADTPVVVTMTGAAAAGIASPVCEIKWSN
jgi:hypothetical protein